jgi:hypothetical protein
MRYTLRTLVIALAVGPPVIGLSYWFPAYAIGACYIAASAGVVANLAIGIVDMICRRRVRL